MPDAINRDDACHDGGMAAADVYRKLSLWHGSVPGSLEPGPPLPGDLPGDRMVHGSGELQEDDRTAAFEVGSQLDPRQPPVAAALAAQVHKCPICRVKRAYPRDEGSLRGPQRHRPVAHPAWHPPPGG